jgi:hypothetical protein
LPEINLEIAERTSPSSIKNNGTKLLENSRKGGYVENKQKERALPKYGFKKMISLKNTMA